MGEEIPTSLRDFIWTSKVLGGGAREMAQQVHALTTLAEDLNLGSSVHMVTHKHS